MRTACVLSRARALTARRESDRGPAPPQMARARSKAGRFTRLRAWQSVGFLESRVRRLGRPIPFFRFHRTSMMLRRFLPREKQHGLTRLRAETIQFFIL